MKDLKNVPIGCNCGWGFEYSLGYSTGVCTEEKQPHENANFTQVVALWLVKGGIPKKLIRLPVTPLDIH